MALREPHPSFQNRFQLDAPDKGLNAVGTAESNKPCRAGVRGIISLSGLMLAPYATDGSDV